MALCGAGFIIGALIGVFAWSAMTGTGFSTLATEITNPKYANAARTFQLIAVFFMFFLPSVITARLMGPRPFHRLGYQGSFSLSQILLTIIIMVACMPLVGALSELTQAIPLPKVTAAYFRHAEDKYNSQAEALAIIRSPSELIFSLFIMALIPALFEETLFRGGLQKILAQWFKHPMVAIIVTSFIFSLMHFSYYGFLGRMALGMVLGLLFHYSGSIWPGVIAHFANNAVVVFYMYYLTIHGKSVKAAMHDSTSLWWMLPSAAVVVALLLVFRNISFRRNINKIPPMDGPSIESNIA